MFISYIESEWFLCLAPDWLFVMRGQQAQCTMWPPGAFMSSVWCQLPNGADTVNPSALEGGRGWCGRLGDMCSILRWCHHQSHTTSPRPAAVPLLLPPEVTQPLGLGSVFGDPTSSVAGIVLSASESNIIALFCQGILVTGPGKAGLDTR